MTRNGRRHPSHTLSHRDHERPHRRLNNGVKRLPNGILCLMGHAAEDRAARKAARLAAAKSTAVTPIVAAPATVAAVRPEEKLMTRYAKTAVVFKVMRGTIIVLVFFDDDSPKHANVFHILEDGSVLRKPKSRAQSYSHEQLREKGWKAGVLEDDAFAPILVLFEEGREDESAAA